MPTRKIKDPRDIAHWHFSFCDKCGTETYYKPGGQHYHGCTGILIDIKQKHPTAESYEEYLARKKRLGL